MPSTRSIGLRTAVLALALAALGPSQLWAQAESTQQAPAAAAKLKDHATLSVENNNWLDAHLYLVRDGMLTSLGFMSGPGKEDFKLPSMATVAGADVQVLVLPIGGSTSYLTPRLVINLGDQVFMTIENNLSLTSVSVSHKG
jgi:hypothetical protein